MAAADISQEEWDRHRGQVVRTAALVDGFAGSLKQHASTLELTRIEMRSLRKTINEFQRGVTERLDKHSDWKETTGQHDLEQLQKQLDKYEAKEERRVALWLKVAIGIAAAIAEAGILHWLKW